MVLPLIAVNLVELLVGQRLRARCPGRWGLAQLSVDALVAVAVVWLFSFDPASALWALLVLPVLEGALRAQLGGALLTWALLSALYVVRELWAAATYVQVIFYLDSVTYRLGILLIIAAATGSLAQGLAVRLDQIEGLQAVLGSTQWVTSLDAVAVFAGGGQRRGRRGLHHGPGLHRRRRNAALGRPQPGRRGRQRCVVLA